MGTSAERLAGGRRRNASRERTKMIKTLEAEAKRMFERMCRIYLKT